MKGTIIVGVTSSVAAYKSVQLVSDLLKKGYDVEVIMTKNATEFITPFMFSSLTKHKTYVETFDKDFIYEVEHISLAKKASLFVIVPATANVIAKVVHGIADDMLTTTFLACNCPKLIAPAMNTQMYDNPVTQDNLALAKKYGYRIIEPINGNLACGDVGKGKLANIEDIMEVIDEMMYLDKPLLNQKVLISAGPTKEKIDPVRYISNNSSGKMGYALARAARNMGADVTLVTGPTSLKKPYGVNVVEIESADEMFEVIKSLYDQQNYVIKSAAVADFKPSNPSDNKIKKQNASLTIELENNPDILAYLGEHKSHQKLCGFAMETEDVLVNAQSKLVKKNCDMLVVNNLNEPGAGFKVDTNVVSILTKNKVETLDIMSKEDLAYVILSQLIKL